MWEALHVQVGGAFGAAFCSALGSVEPYLLEQPTRASAHFSNSHSRFRSRLLCRSVGTSQCVFDESRITATRCTKISLPRVFENHSNILGPWIRRNASSWCKPEKTPQIAIAQREMEGLKFPKTS
jgi:hypothetical protein